MPEEEKKGAVPNGSTLEINSAASLSVNGLASANLNKHRLTRDMQMYHEAGGGAAADDHHADEMLEQM